MSDQAPDDSHDQTDEAWSIKDIGPSLLILLVGMAMLALIVVSFRNGYGWLVGCSVCLGAILFLLIGANGVIRSLYGGWKNFWHELDDTP